MLLVPTVLAASPIHGLGVFAAAPIRRGTCLWRFQPGLDLVLPPELDAALPEHVRAFLDTYSFISPQFGGQRVLTFDNSRFINHSDRPNTDNHGADTIALRDIDSGEEITCDYREFCSDPGL